MGNIVEALFRTCNLDFGVVGIMRGFGVVGIVRGSVVVDNAVGGIVTGIVGNIANLGGSKECLNCWAYLLVNCSR